jgi:hypothetical protein
MRKGAARIEAQDFRVRAIGTQKNRMQLSGYAPVSGVAALAGYEAEIFSSNLHAITLST